MIYSEIMLFSLLTIISGFLGLAYEVIYQRSFSLINGDLYSTYAIIVLTFIAGMSIGNLAGFKLRESLPLLEAIGAGLLLLLEFSCAKAVIRLIYPSR